MISVVEGQNSSCIINYLKGQEILYDLLLVNEEQLVLVSYRRQKGSIGLEVLYQLLKHLPMSLVIEHTHTDKRSIDMRKVKFAAFLLLASTPPVA